MIIGGKLSEVQDKDTDGHEPVTAPLHVGVGVEEGTIVFEVGAVPDVTGLVPDVIAEFVKVHANPE